MAHKQCIEKLDKKCDCIRDDIVSLEVIKNNIQNLEKLIYNYFKIYKSNPSIATLIHYLQLRLVIENELKEIK
jgi:hypothetical protein